MKISKRFLIAIKEFVKLNSKSNEIILNIYYRSIFYRKKHIKKNNYKWLENIELVVLNEKEGFLKYKNLKFCLPKNKMKQIPLHQKYLYASLINYFNIPKYYLLFWDDLIAFHEIFIKKSYDKNINIKNGDIILDVGASIGWYSCKISETVGENGKIIALEPNPENFKYLKKNIDKNNLKNIIPLNLGVWSSKKKMILILEKYSSILRNLNKSSKNKAKIDIDLDTIDNIVLKLKLDKVNLIKMDIEGAEIEALKGAKYTIGHQKRISLMIAAYHKTSSGKETYKTLVPFLEKLNYKIFKEHLPFIYARK